MHRRDFLIRVGSATLALPLAAEWTACSDDAGPDPIDAAPTPTDAPPAAVDAPPGAIDAPPPPTDAPPAGCTADPAVTIGTNHGHSLQVSLADVEVGQARTYDIQGTSPHPHTIDVSPADFQMLQNGQPVTVVSTNDAGHTHSVTLRCA